MGVVEWVSDGFGGEERSMDIIGAYYEKEKAADVCKKKKEAAKDRFGNWDYTYESFLIV